MSNKITVSIPDDQKDFLQTIIHSEAVQWCIDACMRIEKKYGVDACYIAFNDIRLKERSAMTDLSKSFEKLKNDMFFNYRGCLVELLPDGWMFRGHKIKTLDEIDEIIDGDIQILKNSIINNK